MRKDSDHHLHTNTDDYKIFGYNNAKIYYISDTDESDVKQVHVADKSELKNIIQKYNKIEKQNGNVKAVK